MSEDLPDRASEDNNSVHPIIVAKTASPRLRPEAVALVDRIIAATRACFAARSHAPTEEQWAGLRQIAEAIVAMAEGICPPRFYLSALPCGTGKTTILTQSVKALVAEPRYADVGIIILTPRLDQVKRVAEEAGLEEHQFAVRTGKINTELNALGRHKVKNGRRISDHSNAQVLFTTQQKLRQMAHYREHFSAIFPFRGRARMVRIWDETIMPREAITMSREQIELAAAYFDKHPYAIAKLLKWAQGLSGAEVTKMPQIIPELQWDGLTPEFFKGLSGGSPETILYHLSGFLRVHQDYSTGRISLLASRRCLPKGFAPVLILDASGAVRSTYDVWQRSGELGRLHAPGKLYTNLIIRHIEIAAGRSAYSDAGKRKAMADAVAWMLYETPGRDEPMLIVTRKDGHEELREQIVEKVRTKGLDPGRLHWLTWGKHTATNDFAHIKHVVLIGLLQYPTAANESLLRACARKMPVSTPVHIEALEAMRNGEIDHHVLQAVSRGATRRTVDGDVPPGCRLTCLFSSRGSKGVDPKRLARLFPGATLVKSETPRTANSRGDANRLTCVMALMGLLGGETRVSFETKELLSEVPFERMTAQRFARDPKIKALLAEHGVELTLDEVASGQTRVLGAASVSRAARHQ
jgi:hypothetical protein